MSEHTKEPWAVEPGSGHHKGWMVITAAHAGMTAETPLAKISDVIGDATPDADRIVACVNALAGLSDEALGGGWTYAGQNAYALKLEAERDAIRAQRDALLRAVSLIPSHETNRDGFRVLSTFAEDALRAALESCK